MNKRGDPAPVVVGVDGSMSGRDALDWAVAEAAARASSLWVVHAGPPPVEPGPFGPMLRLGSDTGSRDVLREAAIRAHLVAPTLEVTTRLVFGAPAAAILSQRAELIVVGSRRLGGVRGALAGSVSVAVCAHAACPVVVVPPLRDVAPGPSRTRVVVGVDGSDLSGPAIGFALSAAAQRDVGLTALHAWTPRPPADIGGLGDDWAASEATERGRLADALARWRGWFPTVDITPKIVCDDGHHPEDRLRRPGPRARRRVGRGGPDRGRLPRPGLHDRDPLRVGQPDRPARRPQPHRRGPTAHTEGSKGPSSMTIAALSTASIPLARPAGTRGVCTAEAIYYEDDVPGQWAAYTTANVEFFDELGSSGGAAKVGRVNRDAGPVPDLSPQARASDQPARR